MALKSAPQSELSPHLNFDLHKKIQPHIGIDNDIDIDLTTASAIDPSIPQTKKATLKMATPSNNPAR